MGKYFKYAIGEILLVVFGILIALQINNWNQQKKDIKKEEYLIKEMLNEFIEDSIEMAAFIRLTNMKAETGKIIKQYLQGESIKEEEIFPNLFFNGKALLFNSFTPTYDEIVSSGQLNLLRNDSLKILIKSFKEGVDGLETFLFNDISEIKKRYNFHLYKYFDNEIMTKLWSWTRVRDSISPIDYTKGLKKDFTGFFKDSLSYYHVSTNIGADTELHRSYSNNHLRRLEKVIDALRKEIKQ